MPTHAPKASAAFTVLHGTHSSVVLEVRLPDHCVPLAPLRVVRDDEIGHLTQAFNRLLAKLVDNQQ
eukprot:gene33136-37438_t